MLYSFKVASSFSEVTLSYYKTRGRDTYPFLASPPKKTITFNSRYNIATSCNFDVGELIHVCTKDHTTTLGETLLKVYL